MKINYSHILNKNMVNVLKDVLKEIEKKGLKDGHHIYITFKTSNKKSVIPEWIKKKYPEEMTIVIQYEYWNLKVFKEKFEILLSFNNTRTALTVSFNSIISFADPYANFGLKLKNSKKSPSTKNIKNKVTKEYDNIIDFNKFKKSN